jgi:hypothetical protein
MKPKKNATTTTLTQAKATTTSTTATSNVQASLQAPATIRLSQAAEKDSVPIPMKILQLMQEQATTESLLIAL